MTSARRLSIRSALLVTLIWAVPLMETSVLAVWGVRTILLFPLCAYVGWLAVSRPWWYVVALVAAAWRDVSLLVFPGQTVVATAILFLVAELLQGRLANRSLWGDATLAASAMGSFVVTLFLVNGLALRFVDGVEWPLPSVRSSTLTLVVCCAIVAVVMSRRARERQYIG